MTFHGPSGRAQDLQHVFRSCRTLQDPTSRASESGNNFSLLIIVVPSLGSISHQSGGSKHSGYTHLPTHHNTGTSLSLAVKPRHLVLPPSPRTPGHLSSDLSQWQTQSAENVHRVFKQSCWSSETQLAVPISQKRQTDSRAKVLNALASTQIVNPRPQGPAPCKHVHRTPKAFEFKRHYNSAITKPAFDF